MGRRGCRSVRLYLLNRLYEPDRGVQELTALREAAQAELREILHDEPDWKDVLRVVPIEPRWA